jgi:creatinine amidohydrolase
MNHEWAERSWNEIDEKTPDVVLLPVGSTEAHGPHLPLSTDSIISTEIAKLAAERLREHEIHALILPCIDYAITEFSKDFAGTISIRKETFQHLLTDIANNLAAQSISCLCIVNSHLEPDHIQAIQEFTKNCKNISVLFPDKTKKPWGSLLTDEFKKGACHAGCYETSLVLPVREDLVKENVRRRLSPNPVNLAKLMKEGVSTFRKAGADQAYFGDPAAASKEEGEETYRILTRMVVESVLDHRKASKK